MRKFEIFALSIFISASIVFTASADIRVVSDIDDTAKISHVQNRAALIMNGLFSSRAFTGIKELYNSFQTNRGYSFDYVSGAPEAVRFRVSRFIHSSGLPLGEIHLRAASGKETLRDYKFKVIREIILAHPNDRFIFIGDDTQSDFDVYDDLFRYAPDRVLSIYIRKVTNHKLPPSVYPFMTAFDVARTEFSMGRFTTADVAPIALSILSERRLGRIVPHFSFCPKSQSLFSNEQIEYWDRAIEEKVQKICQGRKP